MSRYIDPTTVVDEEYFAPYGLKHQIITEDGKEYHKTTTLDVNPHLLRAEYLRQTQGNRWGEGPKVVATLGLDMYLELKAKGILDDPKKKRAWLRENRALCCFERALL